MQKFSHILKQKDIYNVNPSLHKIDLVWRKEKANQTHLYLNLMIKNKDKVWLQIGYSVRQPYSIK